MNRRVVRLDVISEEAALDRRSFCQLLSACAAGFALGACTDDGSAVDIGPIGDDPGVDASVSTDGAVVVPDGGGGACSGTPTDVGAPTAFASGTATLFGMFFVVRDAGGLYAVSSQCTHRTGVTIGISSGKFRCPRHGAIFNFDGTIVSGPVTRTLVHYAMCLLPNGHAGVSASQIVAANVRLGA